MSLPMHYSHRWLQTSLNIVRLSRQKVDQNIADTKNGAYPV